MLIYNYDGNKLKNELQYVDTSYYCTGSNAKIVL